jgi:type VII secretion-associated serine protease mycosin
MAALAVTATLGAVPVAPAPASAAAPCATSPQQPVASVPEAPWESRRFDPARLSQFSTGAGVTVAVIDSGVDPNHPQMRGHVVPGWDALDASANGQQDCVGHGTAVASVIVAQPSNDHRFQGLAPGVTILPLRVSEQEVVNGQASGRAASPAKFADAIRFAVNAGAKVINMSVVLSEDHPEVRAAVAAAIARNVVVVAAVGNGADKGNKTPYPAAYDGVIGVGAVAENSVRLPESQFGRYVDLVAPGVDITVASPREGFQTTFKGTSIAAPFVSATAALLLSYRKGISASEVAARMFATADPAPGGPGSDQYGYGVVNPYRALTEATTNQPPRRPAALPPPVRDPAAEAAERAAARTRAVALSLAAGVGALALLVVLVANVAPRGRRRGWRPGT